MYFIKSKKAFTLVELIIVITILAILATIAFVSFQSYTKSARDSNRVASITIIQKGIDVFQVSVGNVPSPDNQFGTGQFAGVTLTNVGEVGDSISKLVKLNKVPKDPYVGVNYIYAVDVNKTKYQLATISEGLQSNIILPITYAGGGYKAKVIGNYQGLLKNSTKLYNIPSLVSPEKGTYELTGSMLNFVVNNEENLPYAIGTLTGLYYQSPTTLLQKQANTGAALVVTGMTLPTDSASWSANSNALQTAFGYSEEVIGGAAFGDKYYTEIKTANSSQVAFTCGNDINITVSGTAYTYTTKLGPDGKCWTSKNMVHGTMLANASTLPSNTSAIEKWCYSNDPVICATDGALYTRAEAMGFPASCNTTSCAQVEDTTKSVCGQLGTGWGIPTEAQWNALTASGATGWPSPGNKLSGLVTSLPGYCNGAGTFANRTGYRYGWVAKELSATNAYDRHISSAYTTVSSGDYTKYYGFSVICIKN